MPKTMNAPVPERIHPYELKKEKFNNFGIKQSTISRLKIASFLLKSSYEHEHYLITERALELYYHNTTIIHKGVERNLAEVIRELINNL